ncbi:MAG: ABC transporter ATP-binding protein [Clostridia bacterium]|nr:ABC transporter ATP-binding protein [Clostridia bacterium]
MKSKKRIRWSKYIKPYLAYFIAGPLCMIVEVIGEMMMPSCLARVINNAANNRWDYSMWQALLMVLIAIVMMLGGIGGAYFGAKSSIYFGSDLRMDIYKKIQAFSFANIDKFSTGSLVTRLTNDITQVQNMVNMLLRMALRAPGMMIGALIMAISMRPDLATVLAVTLPLMLISIVGLVSLGFPRFSKVQTKLDAMNSTVQESVTNIRVVKSFVREDHEKKKFGNAAGNLKRANMSAVKVALFMSPVMTLFMNISTIAILWIGSQLIYVKSDNMMPVGNLSAFITYCTQVLSSLMMVTFMFMMLSRALASARRIGEVLNEEIDMTDSESADKNLKVEQGKIEFRNVSFKYYKNREEKVLDNINLVIEPGSTVGIIGSTGCGKTTLVSMIPRLYDVDDGEVLVDGENVRNYTLYNLREGVGMVLQKNVLFSGTIEDNLRWGNEEASMEEIVAASENAQADKFVKSFNGQYLYDLGQGGKNVSGGQKQRLCIARALLKKPKILILDDSTSAVDTATEAQIRKAFKNELADTTKLIIAQRISSVIDADRIVVMNEGKITGIGTHEELIESNEEYREIYFSQNESANAQKGA